MQIKMKKYNTFVLKSCHNTKKKKKQEIEEIASILKCESQGPLYIDDKNVKFCCYFGKQYGSF